MATYSNNTTQKLGLTIDQSGTDAAANAGTITAARYTVPANSILMLLAWAHSNNNYDFIIRTASGRAVIDMQGTTAKVGDKSSTFGVQQGSPTNYWQPLPYGRSAASYWFPNGLPVPAGNTIHSTVTAGTSQTGTYYIHGYLITNTP